MSLTAARDRALEFADRLHGLGPFSVNRFFGGAGLAMNGAAFAFVIKGVLYLRVDDASRPAFLARGSEPFTYATRVRTVRVDSYYALPEEIEDDPDLLRHWAMQAIRAATLAKPNRRPRRGAAPAA